MTEKILVKYLVDHGIYSPKALSSLKALVNEVIQECADSLTGLDSVNHNESLLLRDLKARNRKKILNLKVK